MAKRVELTGSRIVIESVCKECYRPLGIPGEEEQINVVLFVNEN
jgi:hypothetical protein